MITCEQWSDLNLCWSPLCSGIIQQCGRNPPFHPWPHIFAGRAPGVMHIKYNDAKNRNSQTARSGSLQHCDVFENAKHEDYVNDDIKRGAKDDVPVPALLVLACEPVQRTPVHHLWRKIQCGAVKTRSNFHKNIHKRHPIARPLGIRCLVDREFSWHSAQFVEWCAQYHVILDRVITAHDSMIPGPSIIEAEWCIYASET